VVVNEEEHDMIIDNDDGDFPNTTSPTGAPNPVLAPPERRREKLLKDDDR
jgi:hypothetical protein